MTKFLVFVGEGFCFCETFENKKEAEEYAYKQTGEKVMICEVLKEIDNVEYPTLREYIDKHSRGAYHRFVFYIHTYCIDVISTFDFERIYNKDILDTFYVIDDKQESIGNDCTNYECTHHLVLKKKGE